MAIDRTAFDRLAEVVADRKGDGLVAYAREHDGGPEGLLDDVFTNMTNAFLPEKAAGERADFQYVLRLGGDEEYLYFLSVADGTCRWGRGTVAAPKVTMRVKVPDFLRLVTGKLHSMQAFLTGRVRISGDTFYASKFEKWFERP
ncbi:SCP2 sterol-binding domain-containing protein [Streptomyces sp. NPDC094032]|uniref:SCP2 sterol-binding domain-containing protein n=1 Tax=Streptomyces sp. NPDC094032 TaxID=3155308 RepID=UPI00331D3C2D